MPTELNSAMLVAKGTVAMVAVYVPKLLVYSLTHGVVPQGDRKFMTKGINTCSFVCMCVCVGGFEYVCPILFF